MVQDDDLKVAQPPADEPDGGDAEGTSIWMHHLLRRPFLASLGIGLIFVLLAAMLLPSHDAGAPQDVTATVSGSATPELPAPEQDAHAAPATTHAPETHATDEHAAPADTHASTQAPAPKTEAPATPETPAVPIVAEVAVVIADTGLNRKVAEQIDKDMPRDATLAVSAYATDPAGTASAFKASGRDVWLQASAQSLKGGIDPGPLAVSGSLSTKDNMDLFKRQIAASGGNIIGVYIPDDADITGADPDMWRDIAMNLIGENMMILDGTPAKVATTVYMQGQESKISAYLKTDVIVSGDLGPAALQKALADALPIILHEQQAIVVLNKPTVLAVQTLSEWVKTLPSKGIRLVPAAKFTGLKG